jgi:hypothetical protein
MAYIPPVDATQEFKVVTNAFSAEYGRTTGGIVTIVTKGGANDLSGTAYEFHRNSALDANGFFANRAGLAPVDFRRNQFGVVGGGPIRRDRTFFFAAYEGLRQKFPQTLISTVPTELQLRGDFSETFDTQGRLVVIYDPLTTTRLSTGEVVRQPFPGNVIPADRLDPVALKVLSYYPAPNQTGNPRTGADNYVNNSQQQANSNNYTIRIDHSLGPATRLFGRHSYIDMTLGKYVSLPGDLRLQIRADAFNVLNTPRFAAPDGSVTSASFGRVTAQANSSREIQLGVKLYW